MTKIKENYYEVVEAENNIYLLQRYMSIKTLKDKKDWDKEKHYMTPLLLNALESGKYSAQQLIDNLTMAIKLDKYRPRNKSITMLALDKDLHHIGGEFDTFDSGLSKAFKQGDYAAVRNAFNAVTYNRRVLAFQFANDWIHRLDKHKKLVADAKMAVKNIKHKKYRQNGNLTKDALDLIEAFKKLLRALRNDFCADYDIPVQCIKLTMLDNDWENSRHKPNVTQETLSYIDAITIHNIGYLVELPENESVDEKAIQEDLDRLGGDYPNAIPQCRVAINMALLVQKYPDNLFDIVLSRFVHEMHHAMDSVITRQGALGSQVLNLDKKTYIQSDAKDKIKTKEFNKSATELSSYQIEAEFMDMLNNKSHE